MKFHEKLYMQRKKSGMTQQDLAEKLNVSRQAVSRWEMGTAMPEIDNLIAMSDLFGVSLDYLLKEQETFAEPKPAAEPKNRRALEMLAIVVFSLLAVWLLIILLDYLGIRDFVLPMLLIAALFGTVVLVAKYL